MLMPGYVQIMYTLFGRFGQEKQWSSRQQKKQRRL